MPLPRKVEVYNRVNDNVSFIEDIVYGTCGEQASDAVDITGGTVTGKPLTVEAGVSAAGTNQGDATLLDGSEITTVTTVATNSGVRFPTAVAGTFMFVFNADSADHLDVYPASGAAIDDLGTNAPHIIAAGFGVTFYAVSATLWESDRFGTMGEQEPGAVVITGGSIFGIQVSVESPVSAAGTNQATATLLDGSDITQVTAVATDEGVRLPPAVAGQVMFIYNADAGEALDIYPATGDFIDAALVNVPLVLAVDTGVTFYALDGALWMTDK